MSKQEERVRQLVQAMAAIQKQYGHGAIMRLGDRADSAVDVIPTGALGLDLALGCGGYPRGRVAEIFGPESSGKTTLTLHAIASCQALGGVAAFIDAEHALDPSYAARLGVKVDDLVVSQPDDGEQALDIVEQLVSAGAVDLVVVDSVAALVPRAELQGDMGQPQMGLQARLMSQALRKLTGCVHKHNATVIFINQLRQKIGVTFGPTEVTTGGNALKYYASVRLDVRRIGAVKDGEESIGNRTRVRVVKNKMAPPFREIEFDLLYGRGISVVGEIVDLAESKGILQRSGSWYSFDEERLGQGRDRVREAIESRPELRDLLVQRIVAASPAVA